ncbi:DUF1453 domain-containing protein [Isoptericola cucumis]|uniref:DUF1453 domain-containing protein n=1 Tax=Isoptericola cucumis TaxID=1776856 RepID=UPI00166536AC|nr:DUF1453 domain-containing protein [Isoptericola cucumis]
MTVLQTWWPVLVVVVLVVVVVRRFRGEPVDLKDAVVAPAVLLFLGGRTLLDLDLTGTDVLWLAVTGAAGVALGGVRGTTTRISGPPERLVQRYTGRTLVVWVASLVVGGTLGGLAAFAGMQAEARPVTLSIGLSLLGESAVLLWRAHRAGADVVGLLRPDDAAARPGAR